MLNASGEFRSAATADPTLRTILKVAGVMVIISGAVSPLQGSDVPGWQQMLTMGFVMGLGVVLFASAHFLRAVALVTRNAVVLSCFGIFRVRIPVRDVAHVKDDSNFPAMGYGYRILGRGHRGFIIGGPQATLRLHSGREFTVSVESVDEFCSAVESVCDKGSSHFQLGRQGAAERACGADASGEPLD